MSVLHHLGDALRSALLGVPLWAARVLFVGLLVGLLIWVLTLPRDEEEGGGPPAWHRNLRLWACVALLLQILVYSLV